MNYNKDLLSFFEITEDNLKRLIYIALSNGGEFADLYFEHTISSEIILRDGKVNAAGSNIDFGMGVRVVVGDQTGYAYTEITTMKEMEKAAITAAQIANSKTSNQSGLNINNLSFQNYYKIKKSWVDFEISDKLPILNKINDLVFSLDSRVNKVMARISDSTSKILMFNSFGELSSDIRPIASLVATCIMEDGNRVENATSSRSFRMGTEMITDSLIKEISHEVVESCSFLFKAIQPKGGEMPVVMGSGGSGILLHEAIGHAFEADFNRQKKSIFTDKLGKKICADNISVIDDGTIPFNRGSLNVDDEGVESQKTYMVKNGILTSYLHDRISAIHYGVKPTGNGRRESFRFMPLPRMRTTYMENGDTEERDLIAQVKKGIYVDSFSNGQVQIGAGDFTFYVKSGYLIEGGKLTQPIKDINIIGNGPEALSNIVGVGNNFKIDDGTWVCGKEQYCAVSCGMPSILVKSLTVGGI